MPTFNAISRIVIHQVFLIIASASHSGHLFTLLKAGMMVRYQELSLRV